VPEPYDFVVIGSGFGGSVGGGSLVYANVLMKPSDKLFAAPAWRDLADWKTVLEPRYQTACQMFGVTANLRRV
jgi:cholesterol oxidase